MKPNYLFHSRSTSKKFLLGMLLSQVIGVLIFLLVALILSSLHFDYSVIFLGSLFIITVWIFLSAYYLHKEDFLLLKHNVWPFETKDDVIRQTHKIFARLDIGEKQMTRLINKSSSQLIEIVELRKRVNSHPSDRSDFILKELSKLYLEIINGRAKSKEIHADILKQKADITKHLAEFERDGKISAVTFAEDKKRATSVQFAAKSLVNRLLNIGQQISEYLLEYTH